jgi:hypothetical protein
MDLKEVESDGMDWIDVAEDGDKWWALVVAVMNFGSHKMWGISYSLRNCKLLIKDCAP